MNRIRSLELIFNLEKKNLKSKEDCLVAVFHCLFINNGFQCVGVGDTWPENISETTELLPSDWNSNQNVYSLRYISKDMKSRVLLKITKMEHILQIDVVMNEDAVASMSVPTENFVNDFNDYSTTYKDLDSLSESFLGDILQKFEEPKKDYSSEQTKRAFPPSSNPGVPLKRPSEDLRREDPLIDRDLRFPNIGGRDLNPFGTGGGMLMDPSSFGIPSRPTLPPFGPGGLPRGAVPPGARFDPFMPPIGGTSGFRPNPGHFKPPDFDDDMFM